MASKYRLVNFGDVCDHSAFGPRFSSNEYASDGNVACLRTMDMDFSGRINFDAMPLAKLDLSRLQNHILRRDDLVITRTGAYLGKAAVFTQFRLPVVAGAFSICFRLNREIASPIFVRYFFNSSVGQTATRSIATGSAQPNLNIPLLHSLRVPLPPLPAQRKIASILSAYDDLIENNSRRIAILEAMAQAIYREWFVEYRFPGHETVKLVNSPLGKIPERWKPVKVEDAIFINPRTTVPREGEKPFVSMGTVPHNTMLIDVAATEMRTGNSGSKFKNDDTLFARITPCLENGKTAFVQFLPTPDAVAFGSTEFIVLRSKTVSPEFVYLLARSDVFRDNAIKSMSGATGRQRVQEKCFDNFFFAHPDPKTLLAFADFMRPLFKNVFALSKKNANLRKTRDLMLPKLIDGQLDVEKLDIDTGEAVTE